MGLRDDLLRLPLARRFSYDGDRNILYINFEGHTARNTADIDAIRERVEAIVAPLGQKVFAIVNYENFSIAPEQLDAYSAMVGELVTRYYEGVTRYTTSAFLRAKLGPALARRHVAPHIFESPEEAHAHLQDPVIEEEES